MINFYSRIGKSKKENLLSILLLFSILSILLASCGSSEDAVTGQSLKHGVADADLTAQLILKENDKESEDNISTIDVMIINPSGAAIQSVRSWIKYDTEVVSVRNLKFMDERFVLFAPGEQDIDSENGIIKMGAATSDPINDSVFLFASFEIKKLKEEDSALIFYDWTDEGSGHTAILTIENYVPTNILQIPSSLTL